MQKLQYDWRVYSSLVGASLSVLLVRLWINGGSPNFTVDDNPASFESSFLTRTLTFWYLHAFSMWLLILPASLCVDWQMSAIPLVTSYTDTRLVACVLLVLGLAVLALVFVWKQPTTINLPLDLANAGCMSLAILGFGYLPSSNLLFRVGFVVADRVLYIPSIGFCLLLACLLESLRQGFVGNNSIRKHSSLVYILVAVIIGLYASKSIQRNGDWTSEERIYRSGIEANPLCAKCHFGVGDYYRRAGFNATIGLMHAKESVKLWPTYAAAHNLIGMFQRRLGNSQDAEQSYLRAISLDQAHFNAFANLGNLYFDSNRYREASIEYSKAVALSPQSIDYRMWLAQALLKAGDPKSALEACRVALSLNPSHQRMHIYLLSARAFVALGNAAESYRNFQHALAVVSGQSEHAAISLELASDLLDQGKLAQALAILEPVVIAAELLESGAVLHLSGLLERLNQSSAAVRVLEGSLNRIPGQVRLVVKLAELTLAQPSRGVVAAKQIFEAQISRTSDIALHLEFCSFMRNHSDNIVALSICELSLAQCMSDPTCSATNSVSLALDISSTYSSLNDTVGAIRCLVPLRKVHPSNLHLLTRLAELYVQSNQQEDAISVMHECLKVLGPGSTDVLLQKQLHLQLARSAFALKQIEAVSRSLGAALRLTLEPLERASILSQLAIATHDISQNMSSLCPQILSEPEAVQIRAVATIVRDRLPCAVQLLSCYEDPSRVASVGSQVAQALTAFGKAGTASRHATMLASQFFDAISDHYETWQMLMAHGAYLQQQRQTVSTYVQKYRRALDMHPHYKDVLAALDKESSEISLPRSERGSLERLLGLYVNTVLDIPDAHAEVVQSFKILLALNANSAEAHFGLANAVRATNTTLAERHYRDAIRCSSTPQSVYHGNLAALYHLSNKFDDAEREYKTALQLEPDNAQVRKNLSMMVASKKYKSFRSGTGQR
jgi:tetratricopeptide (TPR) repeat protein